MAFYAHTKEGCKELEWQLLSEHLKQTAEIAESFSINEEEAQYFRIAGLIHDFGKYQQEFQDYLKYGGKRGSVPHAVWGARLNNILGQQEISFAIDGHHAGIPDESEWRSDHMLLTDETKSHLQDLLQKFLIDTGLNQQDLKIKNEYHQKLDKQGKELFTRYIFSALTDADWLDTEAYIEPEKAKLRKSKKLDIKKMIYLLEQKFNSMPNVGEINLLRNEVRNDALEKSKGSIGFYTLNLPTGMGKTLTSFYWALKHAEANSLKRIIIVLPFISIIDQTARILKELFGNDVVLEHHYNLSVENKSEAGDFYDPKKLATENWDYPVIVTTSVQFFESLFSNRPSKCRKIHNIAQSIVIFDEVQTLPKEVVLPTLEMLKDVQSLMKVSFLFCTATMPAFAKREGFDGLENMVSLAKEPEKLFEKTRRVHYHFLEDLKPLTQQELLNSIDKENNSTLVIFNTKPDTLKFYKTAQQNNQRWDKIYHLSTFLCPDHRKKIIEQIREDLKPSTGKKILAVSTQLIEAGVDFDFPTVFRALAPLESIIQSAGRCNREWELDFGNVYLFSTVDNKMPDKTYRACAEQTKLLIQDDPEKLHRHNFFEEYYKQILSLFVDADKYKINSLREQMDFQKVNDYYRLIENATEALFIRDYNEESRELMKGIEWKQFLSREDFRRIQAYSVQVYPNFIKDYRGFCVENPLGIKVWYGPYDEDTGISLTPDQDFNWIV
jgi:CRISPR-associated endonuclease/helicase Cas3